MRKNVFENLYRELKIKYGKPSGQWKLWCKRLKSEKERTEVIIGAVLTQRTNWKNVQLAINNLKKAKINSLRGIYRTGKRSLAPLIKPAGFYQVKAGYLLNLAKFIIKNYGSVAKIKKQNAEKLRKELLKIKGIGQETADSILLYALDKPIFVIDEYTRRLVGQRTFVLLHPSLRSGKKRKLSQNLSYDFLQELFKKNLRKNFRLYQDFHALIVIDGKNK